MAYEKKNYYELNELKRIPVPEVLAKFGISVNRAGFFALRNERTPSAKYYSGTNTYFDFGSQEGGDVIKLYSVLSGTDKREAIAAFASEFGILPVNRDEIKDIELTERQWNAIGLYGDMASKNIEFDLEHYSIESNHKYSQKYNMSMSELKKKYLKKYEQLLVTKAVPYVEKMKLLLKQSMEEYFVVHEVLYEREQQTEDIVNEFRGRYSELDYAEKTLKMACRGCVNVKYEPEYMSMSVVNMYNIVKQSLSLDGVIKILQDNPLFLDIYYASSADISDERKDREDAYTGEIYKNRNRKM